jgi:hypothetical protein
MRGLRLFVPACVFVGSLLAPGGGSAQEATPPARAVLQPCAAEPRTVDEVLAVWFGPSGSPAATPGPALAIADPGALPEGTRADDATVQAITEVTQGWISCMEFAGQPIRGFSYMTDNLLVQFAPDSTDPAQDSPDEVRATLEAQLAATPVVDVSSGDVISPLVGPRRARMMDDGRVGAIWSLGGNRYFFLYTQVDDRWLIDDAIDILETEGTPVAGTPVP